MGMKGGGNCKSRINPECNIVNPEEVLYFNINWIRYINDSILNSINDDNLGINTTYYINVTYGTPNNSNWKFNNMDGNIHYHINNLIYHYKNLFNSTSEYYSTTAYDDSIYYDIYSSKYISRNTIIKKKYELLAIKIFYIIHLLIIMK